MQNFPVLFYLLINNFMFRKNTGRRFIVHNKSVHYSVLCWYFPISNLVGKSINRYINQSNSSICIVLLKLSSQSNLIRIGLQKQPSLKVFNCLNAPIPFDIYRYWWKNHNDVSLGDFLDHIHFFHWLIYNNNNNNKRQFI